MENLGFTTTIQVEQTPAQVFNAVVNPQAWWSEEIVGGTSRAGDIFDYHFQDVHRAKVKLTEVIPNQKVVWLVMENYFKPGLFDEPVNHHAPGDDKAEWVDTRIIFEISEKDGKTLLRFKHEGLTPAYHCYDICVNSWSHYINDSMYGLITSGKGQPNGKDKPVTEHEEKLTAAR